MLEMSGKNCTVRHISSAESEVRGLSILKFQHVKLSTYKAKVHDIPKLHCYFAPSQLY